MASFSCVFRPRVTPAAVASSRAQRLHFRAQQAATRDLRVWAAGSEDLAASEPDSSEEDTLEDTTQEASYDPSAPLEENWDKDGSTTEESTLAPTLKLNVVWLDKRIALAVDQVFMKDGQAPVTEYYPWPTRDAWEELKEALEARAWIGEREKILILNQATQVINFWQDEEVRHTLEEARTQFPEVTFLGA